jgi:hypothetical protein
MKKCPHLRTVLCRAKGNPAGSKAQEATMNKIEVPTTRYRAVDLIEMSGDTTDIIDLDLYGEAIAHALVDAGHAEWGSRDDDVCDIYMPAEPELTDTEWNTALERVQELYRSWGGQYEVA